MTGPERIWTASTSGRCHVGFGTPSENYQIEYVRRDPAVLAALPEVQALIAAAVGVAAGKCDAIAAFRQKQLDDDEDKHWQDQDAIMKRAWKMSISGLEAAATAIRALITPDRHDALAAHVAAEVAKARAEDAATVLRYRPTGENAKHFVDVLVCDIANEILTGEKAK